MKSSECWYGEAHDWITNKTGVARFCLRCGEVDREMCQEIDCTCDECGGMMQ